MHIGKTAGISFRYFLRENIPNIFFCHAPPPESKAVSLQRLPLEPNRIHDDLIQAAAPFFDFYDGFCAHVPYGLHQYLPKDEPYTYLTLIREPVERTISAFKYNTQQGWVDPEQDILSWLNDNPGYLDYQLSYLTGPVYQGSPATEKVEIALSRLEQDQVVYGFSDNFNEYIEICCKKFKGFSPVDVVLNKTKVRKTIGSEERAELRSLLAPEIDFYDRAKSLYFEKYKEFIVENHSPM